MYTHQIFFNLVPFQNGDFKNPKTADDLLLVVFWILPHFIKLKKPLSELDPLWQNFLDPRMKCQIEQTTPSDTNLQIRQYFITGQDMVIS